MNFVYVLFGRRNEQKKETEEGNRRRKQKTKGVMEKRGKNIRKEIETKKETKKNQIRKTRRKREC